MWIAQSRAGMSANARDAGRTTPPVGAPDVMAAVDRSDDGARLVIADVSVDDAWLSAPTTDAAPLVDWR